MLVGWKKGKEREEGSNYIITIIIIKMQQIVSLKCVRNP